MHLSAAAVAPRRTAIERDEKGDAIGGVVNVRTFSGRGLERPVHEVAFEGGSFQTFRESIASRGAAGKFDYAVSASRFPSRTARIACTDVSTNRTSSRADKLPGQ